MISVSDFTAAFIVGGVLLLLYLADFVIRRRRK